MSRHFVRCAGVARSRRGNHANGADTRRPSASVTTNSSAVQATSTASAMGLLAKVLIPSDDKLVAMFRNERVQLAQLRASKAARLDQLNRLQPELGVAFRLFHMNMPRLLTFATEEEKPKAANPQNLRHADER